MTLTIVHTIVAVFLIVVILMQMQGSGLSNAFGGGGEFYRSKRSIEQILVWATVILSCIFAVISILLLIPK